MTDEAPPRCEWQTPADSKLFGGGVRCVGDAGHEDQHVVAECTRSSVTYWRVNPEERTARMAMHADLRNGSVLTDEEAWAMWAYLTLVKERDQ